MERGVMEDCSTDEGCDRKRSVADNGPVDRWVRRTSKDTDEAERSHRLDTVSAGAAGRRSSSCSLSSTEFFCC